MYPLKFKPIYKEKIWGGRKLADEFNRELPEGLIGESWELAAHQNDSSKIINGRLAGKTIMEVIKEEGDKILGSAAKEEYYEKFPLLIKLLDANDKLSVQVHPDDDYAEKYEAGELGKTEMWYIIDAKENAKLVYGVDPKVIKEEFAQEIEEGRLGEDLVEIEVEAGDVVYIPAGTVHAIEEGILLAEIQQNSDTTYRVYDWDRVGQDGQPRDLHIDSALEVIDFGTKLQGKVTGLEITEEGYSRNILVATPYFITETLDIEESYSDKPQDYFYVLMNLTGEAKLFYQQGELNIKAGETVLLPASLGKYELKGNCKLIKSYIRDVDELKEELLGQGYNKKDINRIAGF